LLQNEGKSAAGADLRASRRNCRCLRAEEEAKSPGKSTWEIDLGNRLEKKAVESSARPMRGRALVQGIK
jgi:hypothetical protein